MRLCTAFILVLILAGCSAKPTEPAAARFERSVISVPSEHSVAETLDKLEQALSQKGMKIFTRIDHSAGAISVGKQLRPTALLIFGNPKVGTPLMQCDQTAALDLPQKALAWQDESGQVWLSYNSPAFLAQRHQLTNCAETIAKIEKALANFARVATN